MDTPPESGTHLADASKRVAQRLLAIGHNRLELLEVEIQEERERISRAIALALAAAAFGLLTGIALTLLVLVATWEHCPVIALAVLSALYAAAAVFFYKKLARLQREWQTLPGTLDQLKKDRECLEKHLL